MIIFLEGELLLVVAVCLLSLDIFPYLENVITVEFNLKPMTGRGLEIKLQKSISPNSITNGFHGKKACWHS